jgi:hypothetical protein
VRRLRRFAGVSEANAQRESAAEILSGAKDPTQLVSENTVRG